jgi:hypothetical protein
MLWITAQNVLMKMYVKCVIKNSIGGNSRMFVNNILIAKQVHMSSGQKKLNKFALNVQTVWLIVICVLLMTNVLNVLMDITGGKRKVFVKTLFNVVLILMNLGHMKENKSAYLAQIACLIVINALIKKYVTNVMTHSTGLLKTEFVKDLLNVVLMFMNTGLKKDNKSAYNVLMLLITV